MGDLTQLDLGAARDSVPQKTWNERNDTSQETTAHSTKPRRDKTFANFDEGRNPRMAQAYKQARSVASGEAWCALLVGESGLGKTHLAHAAANAVGVGAATIWKVPDFLAFLRRQLADGWDMELLIMNYRSGRFLLVLDDYGKENQTEWANEQMYRILDGRSEAEAPTIITSNERLSALPRSIVSRFRSGLVLCEGSDQRGV